MCLQDTKQIKRKSGIGWKFFYIGNNGKLYGEMDGTRIGKPRLINRWMKSENHPMRGHSAILTYKPGWHIIMKKQNANWFKSSRNVIRKVKFRNAYIAGRCGNSHGGDCIVAEEILILPIKTKEIK